MDHNESKQSVLGIESAEITEIIDHHRIADVQTETPLYIRAEPVGCTCTIITKMFVERKIDIPPNIAMLMLGAILSDTLLFSSPTSTEDDKKAADLLSEIAAIDINEFGKNMFLASTSLVGLTNAEVLSMDRKKFSFSHIDAFVSQINVMDFDEINSRKESMKREMEEFAKRNQADIVILMVTHIEKGGSTLFFAGESQELAQKRFRSRIFR